MAKQSDLVILCIGEDSYIEWLGNIENFVIDELQQKLANNLYELGKPIVVVFVGGKPRVINKIVDKADAVLIGFLPGFKLNSFICVYLIKKKLSIYFKVQKDFRHFIR